jgi:general secretion pathway protein G
MDLLKKQRGFTLLELLIVIVIIGILALLIIPNITSAPKKARDTQRKTDLKAIQKGLEEYFVSNNAYPTQASAAPADTALTPLTTSNPPVIKTIPTDPKNTGVFVYNYTSDGQTYTLHGCLENGGEAVTSPVTNDGACTGTNRGFVLTQQN